MHCRPLRKGRPDEPSIKSAAANAQLERSPRDATLVHEERNLDDVRLDVLQRAYLAA
jgi:hypothetical protein